MLCAVLRMVTGPTHFYSTICFNTTMIGRRELWLLLPEPVRRLPADLAAVLLLTLVTLATVFVPVLNETPLRVLFGLAFVLFLPGYAFIAALFPEAGESPTAAGPEHDESPTNQADTAGDTKSDAETTVAGDGERTGDDGLSLSVRERTGIDGIERVALAFGLSIAIVPLIGLVLNFTPWGIRLIPIAVSVSLFTVGCTAVAAVRRWELPEEERFVVPYREWLTTARSEIFEPDDRVDAALNIALAASILLAVGSVGYAIAVPPSGEQFTEFYLLTEDDDGELVADGYPDTIEMGETAELVIGIENNEHSTESYTVVVLQQEVETEGNQSAVMRSEELGRYGTTLNHNETEHTDYILEPAYRGESLRVQFLLFTDDVPEDPTRENAYRDLHIWIDVE